MTGFTLLEHDWLLSCCIYNVLSEPLQELGVFSLIHSPQHGGRSPATRVNCKTQHEYYTTITKTHYALHSNKSAEEGMDKNQMDLYKR